MDPLAPPGTLAAMVQAYPSIHALGEALLELGRTPSLGRSWTLHTGERCRHCVGAVGHRIRTGGIDRCHLCYQPWSPVQVSPVQGTSSPAVDRTERQRVGRLDRELQLLPLIEEPPPDTGMERWRFGVLCWLLHLQSVYGSIPAIVESGPQITKEFDIGWWTYARVRNAIQRTRLVIEQRARASGVLR